MSKILDQESIMAIARKCEANLTPDDKSRFLTICSKYKLPFTYTNFENQNMIWKHTKELLLASPKRKLRTGKTVEASQTGMILHGDTVVGYNAVEFQRDLDIHILDFVNEIYGKDYDFLCQFDASKLIQTIEAIYTEIGITPPSFSELLRVTNYEKYFMLKLGIEGIDKKEYANTERIAKFFNELFAGVKNKDMAINAVNEYLNTSDLIALHNNLHG